MSGCSIPTELPIIGQLWAIPIEDQSISVVELLPANVDTVGANFQVDVAPVVLAQTLGGLCPACVGSGGAPVPKPAFGLVYNQTGSLPTDVASVQMVSGSISLAIQNNLGFDPIRPAPASPGTMTVTLYDVDASGRQLGQVMLDGTTDALPVGLTTIPLSLAPGTVSSTIFAVIDVVSPAGDPVPIDLAATFDITANVGAILVSSATVDVDNKVVNIEQTTLEVSDIPADLVANIQTGSLILDVQNPFGVAINNLVMEIGGGDIICQGGDPPPCTLKRTLDIGSGPTTSATLSYTGPELQSFLGKTGVFFRGTVTSPGVPATVTPTQVATLDASLDVELEVGG